MDAATERLVLDLLERIKALELRVRELEAENRKLRDQLDEANRKAARQAAPFRRRDSRKVADAEKKRPGRPKDHEGARRAVPEQLDEAVDVPLAGCPSCGGPVSDVTPVEQFIEETPVIRPRVTRLVTYQGTCPCCGEVSSHHPLQTSTATGAAKVQLGPRARALAISLKQEFGLSLRKVCRILRSHFGLKFSAGGLAQAIQRTAQRVLPCFDHLVNHVRASAAVFVDETSWYVGKPGYWLWTFTTADATIFHVDKSRGRQVVADMLGARFDGVLVSDCLASYEDLPYLTHKCIAHHQKAIAQARSDMNDPAYLNDWTNLFTKVCVLWQDRESLGEEAFLKERTKVEQWLDRLLFEERTLPGDIAIQKRIRKRRGSILTCLHHPAAEPTNNRAERALRPAVIARKVSCGNRTERGKEAWQTLTSLATTCTQRGHDFATWLATNLPLTATVSAIPAR